jgi:hypothetical protein
MSTAASSSAGTGRAGAALSTTRVPAARATCAAAFTTSTGTSSWHSSTSAASIAARSASVRLTNAPFAPGVTTIAFSPAASTMITATPDPPYTTRRWPVSTPDAVSLARSVTPNESEPIAPRNEQRAPARVAAIAWLAPFPPGTVVKPSPSTVSPGLGSTGAVATRSMLALPTTTTRGAPPRSGGFTPPAR